MFFVVERDEKGKKNDNWHFWIWDFLSKNGRFVTHICFSKNALLKPLFYSVFWVRAFVELSKKGKFWTPTKNKRIIWLTTEKLFFGIFVFFCFLVLYFIFFACLCFLCFFSFLFLFLFSFLFFFEGLRAMWMSHPLALQKNLWGQKRCSQECVFPSFGRSSGEPLGVDSYWMGASQTCTFFTIRCADLRGNVPSDMKLLRK